MAAQEGNEEMMQHIPVAQLQMQQQQLAEENQRSAEFWARRMEEIQQIDPNNPSVEWTMPELPLARIKKIMKSEDEIKADLGTQKFMISAEAPVMFAKACEIFVLELTQQAWCHTEENKRRTLQRNDIVHAVSKNDIYDFLIDIVPREGKVEKDGGIDTAQFQMMLQQQLAAQQQQNNMSGASEGDDKREGEEANAPRLMPDQQGNGMSMAEMAANNPAVAQQLQYQLMWQQMQMQNQFRMANENRADAQEGEEQGI